MKKIAALVAGFAVVAMSPATAAEIANPASEFCRTMGGRSIDAKLSDGSEVTLCKLRNQKIVEEWTLFRMLKGKKPSARANPFR